MGMHYPYKVEWIGSMTDHLKVVDWCFDNIGSHSGPWYGHCGKGRDNYFFYFQEQGDATMFALRWHNVRA